MITKQQLDDAGGSYVTPVKGGATKKRYYTPDGRIIYRTPMICNYVCRDEKGEVIEQGKRDTNYDEGFLERPPVAPKKYCKYCDRWHDTIEEVEECGKYRKKELLKANKKARAELKNGEDKFTALEEKVDKMADMFSQLMEKLNG